MELLCGKGREDGGNAHGGMKTIAVKLSANNFNHHRRSQVKK